MVGLLLALRHRRSERTSASRNVEQVVRKLYVRKKDFTRLLRNVLTMVWITTQFAKTDRNRDRDREHQLANGNEAHPRGSSERLVREARPRGSSERLVRACSARTGTKASSLDRTSLEAHLTENASLRDRVWEWFRIDWYNIKLERGRPKSWSSRPSPLSQMK